MNIDGPPCQICVTSGQNQAHATECAFQSGAKQGREHDAGSAIAADSNVAGPPTDPPLRWRRWRWKTPTLHGNAHERTLIEKAKNSR